MRRPWHHLLEDNQELLGINYKLDSDDELNELLAEYIDHDESNEACGSDEDYLDEKGNDLELMEEGFIQYDDFLSGDEFDNEKTDRNERMKIFEQTKKQCSNLATK